VVVIRKLIGDTSFAGHTAGLRGVDGELAIAGEGFMPVDGARAVLEGVPAGEYTLELIGLGYCCRFIKGVVVKAGERKEVEIDLPASATALIELKGENVTPAKVAAASVEWQDAKGEVIKLPWPYGIATQGGGMILKVPDLIPEVTRIIIRVPGYVDAVVPFTFAPDAKVSLQATLEPVP
jgi:hypothetical protein